MHSPERSYSHLIEKTVCNHDVVGAALADRLRKGMGHIYDVREATKERLMGRKG